MRASRHTSLWRVGLWGLWVAFRCATVVGADELDFNRDIQPILADACYRCHGPDASQREADLRLDVKHEALNVEKKAIVPGNPSVSGVVQRITSTDPEQRMPPPEAERQLSKGEIAKLTRWIQEGAGWGRHWSLVPPKNRLPAAPSERADWSRNEIDRFVLAKLIERGLSPSSPASRETWIRRVTLDLTGLPPSIEELDAFLKDESPNAEFTVVDRLLGSPRYGERMASMWLDAARYADTSGYQNDGPRQMWRYRDWVIDAFNRNMPFDEFTIRQLAGDLLIENPQWEPPVDYDSAWRGHLVTDRDKLDLLIPSAFNRNHRGNAEGGIIAEEYQAEYVVDRVDTTSTVWLGLTLGCCRCHDHKYDPFTQREFYQLFAYFNNLPEYGRAIKEGNSPPYIRAPTNEQRERLAALTIERDRALRVNEAVRQSSEYDAAFKDWIRHVRTQPVDVEASSTRPVVHNGLVSRMRFDHRLVDDVRTANSLKLTNQDRERTAGDPQWSLGRQDEALILEGQSWIECEDYANFGYFDSFSLSAWIYPTNDDGTVVSRMTLGAEQDGYYLHLDDGKLQFNLVKRWLDDSLRIETEAKLPLNQWSHVVATYDGTRYWQGLRLFVDGQAVATRVAQDFINQTFSAVAQPVRVGGGASPFSGRLDDVRIYDRVLTDRDVQVLFEPRSISELVIAGELTHPKLRMHFDAVAAPDWIRRSNRMAAGVADRVAKYSEQLPTLMVMQELATPRQTHVLLRGQHDQLGERVSAGVPHVLPPLSENSPANRLGLARWIADRRNPLTARVFVNRIWQLHFGVGLVKTSEDFGIQGERPTHVDLLDYLAVRFMESDWDIKSLHRMIATSAVYRQSSTANFKGTLDGDPENRWLSRGPRHRLTAEMIRDQALSASGLLRNKLGGPSVRPYQPEGLWKEIATDTNYVQSHGDDLYRRSLYTYWKRTVAPPSMSTLDAVSREACIVQRARTNTPLQALVLMNETAFVEAARALAARVMQEAAPNFDARVTRMYRLTTSRHPSPRELRILQASLERYLNKFRRDTDSARALTTVGEAAGNPQLPLADWASYTMLASLVLNLDEVLNKE